MSTFLGDYIQTEEQPKVQLQPKVYQWWEVKKDKWSFTKATSDFGERLEKTQIPLLHDSSRRSLLSPLLQNSTIVASQNTQAPPSISAPPKQVEINNIISPRSSTSGRLSPRPPARPSLHLPPTKPPCVPSLALSSTFNNGGPVPAVRVASMVNMKSLLPSPPPSPKHPPPSLHILSENDEIIIAEDNPPPVANEQPPVEKSRETPTPARRGGMRRTLSSHMPKQTVPLSQNKPPIRPPPHRPMRSPRNQISSTYVDNLLDQFIDNQNAIVEKRFNRDHDALSKMKRVDDLLEELELHHTEVMIADQWSEIRSIVSSLKGLISHRIQTTSILPTTSTVPSDIDPLDALLETIL